MTELIIPVVNCSGVRPPIAEIRDTDEFKTFTKELGQALKDVGVVYLINHGIDQALIDSFFEKSEEFFALPSEVKEKYSKQEFDNRNYHGYCHPDDEHFDESTIHTHLDFNEAWDCHGPDAKDDSKFPTEVPKFKDGFDALRSDFTELARKILLSLGLVLELKNPNFFLENHRHFDDDSVETHGPFRSEHLFPLTPEMEIPDGSLRQAAVTSWGSLLFAIFGKGFDGMEIEKANGEWVPVPIIENGIFLNVGLLVENWSGGRIHAIRHRVCIDKKSAERSMYYGVYYLHADADIACTPIDGEHENWNPKLPKHHDKTHGDYTWERFRATRRPNKNK